jgi:Fe2+ transport system protein FeoA
MPIKNIKKVKYKDSLQKNTCTSVALSALEAGEEGVIASLRVSDFFQAERLKALGLVPGAPLIIERVSPVLAVSLQFSHLFMDKEVAGRIFVFRKQKK